MEDEYVVLGESNGVVPLFVNDSLGRIYFPAATDADAPLGAGFIEVEYSGKSKAECIASIESATGCTTNIVETSDDVSSSSVFAIIPSQLKGLYSLIAAVASYSGILCIANDEGERRTVAWNGDREKCIREASNGWTGNTNVQYGLTTELPMTVTDTSNFVIEYNGMTYTFVNGVCDRKIGYYNER